MSPRVDQGQFRRKMNRVWAVAVSGVLLLAGCAVGPDYRHPETSVPTAWSGLSTAAAPQPSVTTTLPAELVQWWKTFDDPMLTSLIERAIAANLDLRQAEARVRQARATRGMVASALWPEIDANASYSRSRAGGSSSGSGGTGNGVLNLYQAGLDAAWELDVFGGVRRSIEAAQADLQASEEDRRDVLVTLVAEVGVDYVSLRGLQQQIFIARNNLEAQKHTAEITRKRFEAGFVSRLDVANAYAQVATTEANIPLLESAAQATIYNLSVLLGLQPAALAEELGSDKPIPTTPPEVPVGLPSDLLRRRPDIRRAEARLHGATARIGVATADLFPRFSLTGSFGFLSTDLNSLGNWSSRFWSFGPGMSWPIFTAGRIQWNIELQKAVAEQDLAAYEQTILIALKDVETALVAYAKDQERIRSLTVAVANNRSAVDLSTRLYVAGKSDFLNVLVAQRSLNISEEALVLSTRSQVNNLIALYKALGGGWEKAPLEAETN